MTDGKHSVTTEEASVLTKVAQLMTLRSTRGSTDDAFVTVYPSRKPAKSATSTTGPSKRSPGTAGLATGGSPKKK
jgi:hypothetical protein